MTSYTSATPEQLNAMTAPDLLDLYGSKRNEMHQTHGELGMWGYPDAERRQRLVELEVLYAACGRKLAVLCAAAP